MKYTFNALINSTYDNRALRSDGTWTVARPYNCSNLFERIGHCWLVLTGRADIVVWPKGQ